MNVALDHCVYGYLQRLETEGKLPIDVGGIKPYSRNEIAIFINAIDEGGARKLTQGAPILGLLSGGTAAYRRKEKNHGRELCLV